MKLHVPVFHMVWLSLLFQACYCHRAPSPSDIVRIARSYINRSFRLAIEFPAALWYSEKSFAFVAKVLQDANAVVPKRSWARDIPVGADEWENPNSLAIFTSNCWRSCYGVKRPGDVIAMDGHVAVVTTNWKSTSLGKGGIVRETSWGFQFGQKPTCWRFRFGIQTCSHN